jgi:small subunit ribosomal protein S17
MSKKKIQGIVTSDKMDKVIVVSVPLTKVHQKYKKSYIVHNKFIAKDSKNKAKKDDFVTLTETKPFSKNGRWELTKIHSNINIK